MQRNNRGYSSRGNNTRGNTTGNNTENNHGRPNSRRNNGTNRNFPAGLSGFDADLLGSKMFKMMNALNQVQVMSGKKAIPVLDEKLAMKEVGFPTDIIEKEAFYHLEAELPGFKKEDITLSCCENTLTILAEHKEIKKMNVDKYIQKERKDLSLSRSFTLDDVDDTHIKASYEDGILRVLLQKQKKTEKRSKKIQID